MIQIPVANLNSQVMELTLTGDTYFLSLDWNDTCQFWSAGISDSGQNVLLKGIALVPGYFVFYNIINRSLPVGFLMVIPPDRRDTVSFTDLTSGVVALMYGDFTDLTSIPDDVATT